MTYCLGMLLKDGIVLLADTRTMADVDHISSYSKLHIFEKPGERVFVLLTAGNLAITQSTVNYLLEGLERPDKKDERDTLETVPTMFQAAQMVGRALRQVYKIDGEALREHRVRFEASLILAGQIKGAPMQLFQIYSAGNFIEATAETPYFQIGEHKYGKPILDRVLSFGCTISDAVKLGLLSMDSTIRSNLTVGLPVDVAVIPKDACRVALRHRITEEDEDFRMIREKWGEALRQAWAAIPTPSWLAEGTGDFSNTDNLRRPYRPSAV
ncbi:MAG TPA: proteasome-type protease [Sphingomonadales bacterium]